MEPSAREALGRLIAAEHRLHEHMRQQEQLAERWRARAEMAARRAEDQLAREALARQAEHEQRARELRRQYLGHAAAVRNSKRRLSVAPPAVTPAPLIITPSVDPRFDQLVAEDRLDRDLRELKEKLATGG